MGGVWTEGEGSEGRGKLEWVETYNEGDGVLDTKGEVGRLGAEGRVEGGPVETEVEG